MHVSLIIFPPSLFTYFNPSFFLPSSVFFSSSPTPPFPPSSHSHTNGTVPYTRRSAQQYRKFLPVRLPLLSRDVPRNRPTLRSHHLRWWSFPLVNFDPPLISTQELPRPPQVRLHRWEGWLLVRTRLPHKPPRLRRVYHHVLILFSPLSGLAVFDEKYVLPLSASPRPMGRC